jgi:serine/threonine protein kinase
VSDQPTQPIFNGRYRVERTLARGGMAEVYLGEDLVLHRAVALKVLAAELSRDEGFVERFRREAQAAAGLSHPNIVGVYDWGEADGSYFIVMEYVAGQTLAHLIRDEGPLSTERIAAIGTEIAAALAVAHRSGVVHRDVKPSNVLIGSNGQVKVTDFGIARSARWGAESQLTQTGLVLGTAAYLSPEQAEGRIADPRSDLYALGVVLYEMATGRPPFRGDNPVSVAYQHAREQPEPPSRVDHQVPAWLEAVILKALAKAPEQRYSDAEDLRSALSQPLAFGVTTRLPAVAGGASSQSAEAPTVPLAPTAILAAPTPRHRPAEETSRTSSRSARPAAVALLAAALIAAAVYLAAFESKGAHSAGQSSSTTGKPSSTSTLPATTEPPASTTTNVTSTAPPSTSGPTSFAGYQIVAGSGTSALYCPTGAALGTSGTSAPAGPPGGGPHGHGPSGPQGHGGTAGCGSNGGPGGMGGSGAPRAAGGVGGDGGDGGCPAASLAEMRAGQYPCNGTGSNGGGGGNGGNAAPGETGGSGGRGGRGGDAENAKGGNGGNGGNATPAGPGGPGAAGQQGGGSTGNTPGVNGQNGGNGGNGGNG